MDARSATTGFYYWLTFGVMNNDRINPFTGKEWADKEWEEIEKNIPEGWQDAPFHSTTSPLVSLPSRGYEKEKGDTKPPIAAASFTSLDDLLKEPEEVVSWVVDGLLPSGGLSVLVAKPKVGKSTFARQMALAVAQGDLFLGRKTAIGRVLYISLEEKRGEVRSHFKLMGANGAENIGIYVGTVPEEAFEWLKSEIIKTRPTLVIIDTLFRFVSVTDVNDYAKTTAALSPLLALARDYSAHLLFLHHARKGGGDGADTTLGSTAIFGSVDTAIVLKKTDGKRTIETQQRYGVDLEPTILVFNSETKSAELGGSKEEDDIQKIEAAILEFLKTKGEGVSEPAIGEEIDGRTGAKRKALRNLLAKEHVSRVGGGRRGDPFLYSCSLVPDIYTGQEKQSTETVEKPNSTNANSSSQETVSLDDF